MSRTRWQSASLVACLLLGAAGVSACRQDMHDNPKYKPYRDGAMRELPEGTVARGSLALNPAAPKVTQAPAAAATAETAAPATQTSPAAAVAAIPAGEDGFPFKITKEILDRGQRRYEITCSPCHGILGDGHGMVAVRGLRRARSYHEDRLRKAPASYFYDVITNGFGIMPNYTDQLSPEDRWKVIAYIRVLQVSQNAAAAELPESDRKQIEEAERKMNQRLGTHSPAQTASGGGNAKPSGGNSN